MHYILIAILSKITQLEGEEELLIQIKKNPKLFSIVYDKYYSNIFSFVVKRTLNFELARDITSEVFLKAYLNIQKFKWRGISIKVWIYKIALTEINLYFRNLSYRPSLSIEVFGITEIKRLKSFQTEVVLSGEMESLKKYRKIINAINELPEKQKKCVSLFYFDNLTYVEISEILALNIGTIKSNISRGIKKVKEKCNPH